MSNKSSGQNFKTALILSGLIALLFAIPYHLLISNPFSVIVGSFDTLNEIKDIYLDYFKSTSAMNLNEIAIWIILPTFLICLILSKVESKIDIKRILLGLLFGLIIYATAFLHNQININQRYNSYLKLEIPRSEQLFNDFEYNNATYKLRDYSRDFGCCKGRSISFETTDNLVTVVNYYLGKGFKVADGATYPENKKYLLKHSGYNYGSENYASVSVERVENITKVRIEKLDYHFT